MAHIIYCVTLFSFWLSRFAVISLGGTPASHRLSSEVVRPRAGAKPKSSPTRRRTAPVACAWKATMAWELAPVAALGVRHGASPVS